MGIINLYRLTATGDNKTVADRIDFNDPGDADFKDAKKEGAYCTKLIRKPLKGIGDNQGASQDLGDLQSLGQVEDVYELHYLITKRNGNTGAGDNAFLAKLKTWDDEPATSDNWPEGRFGLDEANEHSKDLIPVRTGGNQIGLVWESISYESDFAKNQETGIIRLRVSKGDGT